MTTTTPVSSQPTLQITKRFYAEKIAAVTGRHNDYVHFRGTVSVPE